MTDKSVAEAMYCPGNSRYKEIFLVDATVSTLRAGGVFQITHHLGSMY